MNQESTIGCVVWLVARNRGTIGQLHGVPMQNLHESFLCTTHRYTAPHIFAQELRWTGFEDSFGFIIVILLESVLTKFYACCFDRRLVVGSDPFFARLAFGIFLYCIGCHAAVFACPEMQRHARHVARETHIARRLPQQLFSAWGRRTAGRRRERWV